MKEIARKIVSFSMALLLLASTTSWKVEKHFCMGRLVDMAFFASAEDCGMSMGVGNDDGVLMQQEDSCCNDEVILIVGQDGLKLSLNDLDVEQQSFPVAFVKSYIDLFNGLEERIVPHEQYPPPLLVKNIQLLDQVFLI